MKINKINLKKPTDDDVIKLVQSRGQHLGGFGV